MSYFPSRTFPDAAQQANLWVCELADRLGCEQQTAYEVLRAILHALRDSLATHDAAEIANHLPLLLRGIYYENWHPATTMVARNNVDQILPKIGAHLDYDELKSRQAVAALLKIMELRVSPHILTRFQAILQDALSSDRAAKGSQPA